MYIISLISRINYHAELVYVKLKQQGARADTRRELEEKCNHGGGGLCCVKEPSLKSVTKNERKQHPRARAKEGERKRAVKYYDCLFGSF